MNPRCQTRSSSRDSTPAPSASAVFHDRDDLIPSMPCDLFQPLTLWGFVFPVPLLLLLPIGPEDPLVLLSPSG
jgi:hypothetical protein